MKRWATFVMTLGSFGKVRTLAWALSFLKHRLIFRPADAGSAAVPGAFRAESLPMPQAVVTTSSFQLRFELMDSALVADHDEDWLGLVLHTNNQQLERSGRA
jgi:hypothetical protein